MGFQIAPTLIIFLVILGAGLALCCGLAIMRLYSGEVESDARWTVRSPEQDAYMREVRQRNWSGFVRAGSRDVYNSSNLNLAHAPVSVR